MNHQTERDPLIFLLAGEPSGDQLGARLMAALKAETEGRVHFVGVGGDQMAAEGLESLFPMRDLSVMGFVEVVPHLRTILRRLKESEAAVRRLEPQAVVTIDSPGFCLRLMMRISGGPWRRIHFVAPQVWAWKPGRAKTLAQKVDRLLALLPFEPPLFEAHGLKTDFVGHPVVEAAQWSGDAGAYRARLAIPPDAPIIALLPGSRRGEVQRLLPVFADAFKLLQRDFPDLHAIIPTVSTVADSVRDTAAHLKISARVVEGQEDRYAAFAVAQAGLAASGTVAAEMAVVGLPGIIAYRVNPLTAYMARKLIRVRYVSLPNLVLDREVYPEMLQDDCRPDRLAQALQPLLRGGEERERQVAGLEEAARALGLGQGSPSYRAARAILDEIGWEQERAPDR